MNCRGRDCNRDDCGTCTAIREHYERLFATEEDHLRDELARLRPVVEAAEALVEHWKTDGRGLGLGPQMVDLAERVKEAQR